MSRNKLQEAADIHRRWTGVGPLLFVIFYSLFFATHVKLEKSMIYIKNDVVLAADTASFFIDMTAPQSEAGAGGTGVGNAFLLLHHEVTRLLIKAWAPFSEDPNSAPRHVVAALTCGAGAITVVLLYLTLMWSGVSRLRATLLAAIFGASTAGLVFSVLPQPYIFGAMGFMAALAAIARGQEGEWWEFSLAALYTACCSFWHVIPLLLLALVRGARASSGGSDMQPIIQAVVSVVLLAVASLGAMKAQGVIYPRTASVKAVELVESVGQTLGKASVRTAQVSWAAKVQDVFFANIAAPTLAAPAQGGPAASSVAVQAGPVERSPQAAQHPWFVPNLQYAIWAVWLGLLLAGIVGMPMAFQDQDAVLASLLIAIWFVWLDGVLAPADARLLHSALWTPAVIFLIGVGLEQHVDRWSWMRWPVTVLLAAFLGLEGLRNAGFMSQVIQMVAL